MLDFKKDIRPTLAALDYLNDPEATDRAEELNAMDIACDAAIVFAERHAALADTMAASETDLERKTELQQIASVCRRVAMLMLTPNERTTHAVRLRSDDSLGHLAGRDFLRPRQRVGFGGGGRGVFIAAHHHASECSAGPAAMQRGDRPGVWYRSRTTPPRRPKRQPPGYHRPRYPGYRAPYKTARWHRR